MTQPSPAKNNTPRTYKDKTSPRLMSGQLTVLSILVAVVPLLCVATLGYVFTMRRTGKKPTRSWLKKR